MEEVGEGRAGESLSFPLIILNLPKEFTSFSVQVRRILLSYQILNILASTFVGPPFIPQTD